MTTETSPSTAPVQLVPTQDLPDVVTLRLASPERRNALSRAMIGALSELLEALVKAPMLITEGLKLLEATQKRPAENPLAGLRTTLLAGACMIAAAILVAFKGPWYSWVPLFAGSILLALWRKR